ASRGIVTPCISYTRCVKPEQSKPKPDVPPHKYGSPWNTSAMRTTSAPDDGKAATPGADTATSLRWIDTAVPAGSSVCTHTASAAGTGNRVAIETSTVRVLP